MFLKHQLCKIIKLNNNNYTRTDEVFLYVFQILSLGFKAMPPIQNHPSVHEAIFLLREVHSII